MEHTVLSRQTPETGTEAWSSCTPRLLVYTPYAARRQKELIGWLRDDFPRNKNEQGGWLIGRYLRDASGKIVQVEVTELLEAKADCRQPGYIEWSAMEEIRLQQEFFGLKERLAVSDPVGAEELACIGWWHTHPNELSVFFSSTDLETQRLKYYKTEKYAVVLNPHRGVWRAFAGADAVEVPAIMLAESSVSEPQRSAPPHKAKNAKHKHRKEKRRKRK